MKGYTVEHSDFWGFGERDRHRGLDPSESADLPVQLDPRLGDHRRMRLPQRRHRHARTPEHESYAAVDHNTIEFLGNTNLIAWQNGTYSHNAEHEQPASAATTMATRWALHVLLHPPDVHHRRPATRLNTYLA